MDQLTTFHADRNRRFEKCFARLAVAFHFDSDAVTLKVYAEALADLPIDCVEDAAKTLAREDGRRFFPSTAEWHSAGQEAVEAELRESIHQARAEPWHIEHPAEADGCNDTGWHTLTCEDGARCGRKWCERQLSSYTHSYVEPCSCRSWNRTWMRNQLNAKVAK